MTPTKAIEPAAPELSWTKRQTALIVFVSTMLSACGYLQSTDDVQAWAMEQIKEENKSNPEFALIKLEEVQLVRESANKFTGFAQYSFDSSIEKVPTSIILDGNKKLLSTSPPEKLRQMRRDQYYSPSDSMKLPIVFPKHADAYEVASTPPFINEMIRIFGGKAAASNHLENLRAASNMVRYGDELWIGCGCFPGTGCYSSMAFTVHETTGEVVAATAEMTEPGSDRINVRYWGARSMSDVPAILQNWKGGNSCDNAATLQSEPSTESKLVDMVGTGSWDCGTMADCTFEDNVSKKSFTAGRSKTDPIGIIMNACGEKLCKVKAHVEMYEDGDGGNIASVISAEPVH